MSMISVALHHVSEHYSSGDSYEGTVKRLLPNAPPHTADASKPASPTANNNNTEEMPSAEARANSPLVGGGEGAATTTRHVKHGNGRYAFADGSYYDGEWANGQMEGRGTFFEAATSDQFDGVWRGGRRVQGVYRYGDSGNMYIGGFDAATGAKKVGPALVLDGCVLYKALYAEDRLITRELILMPAHRDWASLVGGLGHAHASNPNKYSDPLAHMVAIQQKPQQPHRAGSPTPTTARATSPIKGGAAATPSSVGTPRRAQPKAGPNASVPTPSPAAYRRAMSPVGGGGAGAGGGVSASSNYFSADGGYSRTPTVGGAEGNNAATPISRYGSFSYASVRSPSPNAAMRSIGGGGGGGRVVTASYKAPHVLITSTNRAVSPTGRSTVCSSPNRYRQHIAANSGRNVGAGPVTVGIAPALRTAERCASPQRQIAFAQLCADADAAGSSMGAVGGGVVTAMGGADRPSSAVAFGAGGLNGARSSGIYSNNTYYEDVTSPDHPIGRKLLRDEAKAEEALRKAEAKEARRLRRAAKAIAKANKTNDVDAPTASFVGSGGGGNADRAAMEGAGEARKKDAAEEASDDDVTVSSEDDDDHSDHHNGGVGRSASRSRSRGRAPSVSAAAAVVGAEAEGNNGDAMMTQEEALDAAKAVLRQRRDRIEAEANVRRGGTPSASAARPSHASAFVPVQQQQQQLSASHAAASSSPAPAPLLIRNGANATVAGSTTAHSSSGIGFGLRSTTPTGYGASLYGNGGGASTVSDSSNANNNNNGALPYAYDNNSGMLVVANHHLNNSNSANNLALIPAAPAPLMKSGAVVMAPPNARNSTCRSLSAAAFGDIQRGRARHVDDVSRAELDQAYRYFNYNKGAASR